MKKINYFDLGLYKDGLELNEFNKNILPQFNIPYHCYGIEAEKEYFDDCEKKFKNKEKISLYNLAINDKNEKIKLYKASNPLGNSLFINKSNVIKNKFTLVNGITFSQFLLDNKIDITNSINICKINIEGAEIYLFEDLIKNDLLKYFHFFLGTGHDLRKIPDKVEDGTYEKYLNLLEKYKIDLSTYYVVGATNSVSNEFIINKIKNIIIKKCKS